MQKNPLAKMNEQWLLVLGIYLCLFGYNLADNDGRCIIANIPDSAWTSLYLISANDDSTTETVLFESEYTEPLNITSITPGEDNNKIDFTKYFKITAEDGKFIITATDEMQNFDSAIPKQPVNYIVGSIQLQIECAKGISQLNLQTKVTDVNEHAPDLKKNYLFKVASPIMTLTDFTIYGSPIQATDLDFSNQNVAFTMDPDDFDITTVISEADSKTYIPVFKAKRVLLIGKQKSYTLTATDTGTIPGTKSSTSNVTLEANADSLETPIFNKHAFHFNYSTTNENYSLNIIDGPITLISTKLNITTFELSGDLAPEFDIDLDQTTGKITVTLNSELDTQLSVVTLTLVATTDNSAVVSLIVYMPQSSIQFSSHSYTGNYDLDTNTVSVKPDIEIVTFATTGTPEVTMIGTLTDHFSVVLDNKTNTYVINVVKNLTYTELKENLPLEYVLAISVEDKTDTASLVINAVLETIQFSQQFYTAVYNPDDDSVTSDISVSFKQDLSASSITIEGSYADNFKFVADTDKKNWNLQVITPLEGDVLKSETMIMLKIIAEDKNKQTAYAVVEITLPKGPKFTKSYYSATYTVNKDKLILFDEGPTFEGTVNPKDVTIELDSFKDNFEILYNDEWQIAIKNVLNDSVIANSDIRITLTATELKKTNIGTTVLILTIPVQEAPIFSSVFYNIDYPDSGTDIMYFKPDLTFTNIEDQNSVTISLDGDYSANFKAVYDNDKWQMKILSTLDTAVLVDNTEITLTLSATQNNNEHKGIAVLIVQLPSVKGPKFSKTHYKGQYIVNENTHTISLTESIVVTSVDDEVNITVDSYSENFEVQYNADNKEYKFVLKSPLTQDILDSNVDLIIGVEATDFIGTVYATVVLNIDTGVAPEFSQIYYRADYDSASKELVLDNIIQINNQDDLKNIAIAIDESYISNFNLTYNSKTSSWDLTVTSPPSSDAVITITATSDSNDKTGTATLAFIIKIQEPDLPPVFSQPYYSAQYTIKPDNTSDIIKADPIEITNNNSSKITLTIEEKYDKNFKLDLDTNNNQWNLKISTPLTDDILNNYTELILTLTAADKDTKTTGKSTLIITLPPHKVVGNYLNFKEVHYTGQYKTFSKVVDLDNKIDITSNKDLSDVLILLTDNSDGLKYFNINHTADGYQIDVLTPVPDDVLKTTQSFIFTLLAEVDGLKGYATLVLNLPKIVETPISFKEVLYYGNYDSKGGEISLNDTITFTTEEPIDNIDVFITSDFGEYFAWNISDKEISLTTKNTIPADVLKNNSTISLIISAKIKNTDFQAITVVNLAVIGLSPSDTIAFEDVLYNGKYTSEDNKLDVKPINIITDTTDKVQTSITDENGRKSEYFEAKCTNKVLTVSKLKDLPESVLAESTSLTLTLTVTIQGTSISASSVLNIKIVKPEEIIIQFDKILYTGEYTEDAGRGNLKIANISLIEKNVVESDINVYLEDDEGYSIYFNVSLENNTVTIILQEDIIPREVTENNPVITLALTAETGSDILATAIVNIKIINDDQNQETIKFDKVLYNGEYTVDNQKGNLSISDNITLLISDTNVQDRDINLSFADGNDFNQYFTITQAKEIVTVELSKEALPDNVINDKYVITLTLNAEIISKKQTASAVLNINILKPEEVVVQFDQLLYTGEYTEAEGIGNLTFDDINLREENVAETNLTVTLKDDAGYSAYFKASLKNSVVAIKLAKDIIPEEVTENNPVITLTLTAEKDSDVLTTAIINIKIINSSANDTGTILFEKNIYNGELSVSRDGTQNLTISEVIKTITDSPDDEVVPTIIEVNGLSQYFKPGYKNKIFTVTLSEELPAAIISEKTIIALTLQTQIKNTSKIAISILNILIVNDDQNQETIKFDKVLYNGEYTVDNQKGNLSISDNITLLISDTNVQDKDINLSFADGNDFNQYFTITQAKEIVTVELSKEALPDNVINDNYVITLTLNAEIISTKQTASAVLNINILKPEEVVVQFDQLLYTGEYTEAEGIGNLTFDDINLREENVAETDLTVTLKDDAGYSAYFKASLKNSVVAIKLAKDIIPEEVTENNPVITLTLTAEKDSDVLTTAIINIKIINSSANDTGTILFEKNIYNGELSVSRNGTQNLTISEVIKTITDSPDDEVVPTIIEVNGLNQYFKFGYKNKIFTVTLSEELPAAIISEKTIIALTLQTQIKNTSKIAISILNILIVNDDQNQETIKFDKVLYNGEYTVDNQKGNLSISDNITLLISDTNVQDKDINLSFADGNDFNQYFTITQAKEIVTVELSKEALPDNVINDNYVITLTLNAEIISTKQTASAVLNINILKPEEVVVQFDQLLYTGEYTEAGGIGNLTFDDINLREENVADTDLTVTLKDDAGYSAYFKASLKNNVIAIKLAKDIIPEEVTENNPVITLTLTAEKDSDVLATAIVNIKIINSSANDTGTILFEKNIYNGELSVSRDGTQNLTISEVIKTITDSPDDEVVPTIIEVNGLNQYFKPGYKNKIFTVTLSEELPAAIISDKTIIALTLQTQIKNTSKIAISILNILIVNDDQNQETIKFDKVLYNGEYTADNQKGNLSISDNITLLISDTNVQDKDINLSFADGNDFNQYFTITQAKEIVTVKLSKEALPDNVINDNYVITLTLNAEIISTKQTASAVLNINILKPEEVVVQFGQLLYTGEYSEAEGIGNLKFDDINLREENVAETDLTVTLKDDAGFSAYFKASLKNSVVAIKLAKDIIPEEVTENNPVVTLTLTAEKDSDVLATAIINIKIINSSANDTGTILFEKNIYNGELSVSRDGTQNLNISEVMKTITDSPDDEVVPTIIEVNGLNQYFKPEYKNKIFTVALSEELPAAIISGKTVIALTLQTQIKNTSKIAISILNILIVNPEEFVVQFDQLLYTGEYTEAEGIGNLKFDDINLHEENVAETDLTVTLKDGAGYSDYFKPSLKNNIVAIKLTKDIIPEEVTENNPVITLTLTAEKDSDVLATAIINIKIINSSANDTGTILFEKHIYNGELSVSRDGTQNLNISEVIKTITDSPDDEVVPTIIEVNGLNQYFKSQYKNKIFTVTLSEKLPAEIISGKTVIALTLQTQIKNTSKIAISILNILIDRNKPNTGYINFSSSLYKGQYSVNDTAAQITHDDISLDTDQDESDINVTVTNEYAKYFSAHYENKLVKITIEEPVPKDIYNTITVIPLVLTAQLSTESLITGTTIVNLLVNSDSKVTNDTLAFVDPLYTGKYEVDENNKGQLTIEKDIKIITNRLINDIKCSITNDQGYSKYFNASLSNTIFTVLLSENLPDEIVNNNTFIALTLEAELSSTKTAVTILNIQLSGKNPVDNDLRFSNTLYKGTYQVLNNKPSVKYDDMSVVTNYAADKIILTLTSTEYSDYFSVSLSDKIVILHTKDAIPKDMIKNMSYVALTLKAEIKDTTISASSVLTLQVEGNNNGRNVKSTNITPYVVFLIILSIVILVMIAAAVVFYYFRIRQKDYTDVDEEFWKVRFADNADKKMKKKSGSEVRRPTGFVFNHLEEEGDPTVESSVDPEHERRKSVVFDENIEKMPIDSAIDESRKSS